MGTYVATVSWARGAQPYTDGKYSRAHTWRFDGGVEVPGSSSPHVVRPPLSDVAAVDPEEAFVASLASCHMLFFLDFARRAGVIVTSYDDEAEGEMEKGDDGKTRITRITLRPRIVYGDVAPTDEMLGDLHHKAHEACFIANSITSEIVIEPR